MRIGWDLFQLGGWTFLLSVLSVVLWRFIKRYASIVGHAEPRLSTSENWGTGYSIIRWSRRTAFLMALGLDVTPRGRDHCGQWYDARFHKFK